MPVDKKISQLATLVGADLADADLVAMVDSSGSLTGKVARSEFFINVPGISESESSAFFSNLGTVNGLGWRGRIAFGESYDHNLAEDGSVTGGSFAQSFTALDPSGTTQTIDTWDYGEDRAQMFGATTGYDTLGLLSRTSDTAAVYTTTFFHINESASSAKGGAMYIDAIRNHATAGDTFTIEANLANLDAALASPSTPYNEVANYGLDIIRLGAGSDASIFGNSFAIDTFIRAIDNGGKAHTFLQAEHNAILRDDQTDTPGVADGTGYGRFAKIAYNIGFSWYSSDPVSTPGTQAEVVRLRSEVTDDTVKWRTGWTDTAFIIGDFDSPNWNFFGVNYDASAVNGLFVTPSDTGDAPGIAPQGSDTNINFKLDGKGSGGVYTPSETPFSAGTSSFDTMFNVYHASDNTLAHFESGDRYSSVALSDNTGSILVTNDQGGLALAVDGDASTPGTNATNALEIATDYDVSGNSVMSDTYTHTDNRLMITGAFGLGDVANEELTDVSVTDASIGTGFYRAQGSATGAPDISGHAQVIHVRRASGGGESMLWLDEGSSRGFIQSRVTGSWGGWREFVTSDDSTGDVYIGGSNVTASGWGAPTGTATRTTFDTSTVTLSELAERVHAIIDDLTTAKLLKA